MLWSYGHHGIFHVYGVVLQGDPTNAASHLTSFKKQIKFATDLFLGFRLSRLGLRSFQAVRNCGMARRLGVVLSRPLSEVPKLPADAAESNFGQDPFAEGTNLTNGSWLAEPAVAAASRAKPYLPKMNARSLPDGIFQP